MTTPIAINGEVKQCCRCEQPRLLAEFYSDRRAADGLFSACKECTRVSERARKAANPEKVRLRQRSYYAANPEKYRARDKERHQRDRTKRNARTRKWAAENPQKKAAGDRAWYSRNRGYRLAKSSEWAKQNHTKVLAIQRNRKARMRAALGAHTAADIQWLHVKQNGKCPACRGSLHGKFHVDHIVALINGGTNYKSNLQLLCPTCNLQKNRKHPVTFMQERGYLL